MAEVTLHEFLKQVDASDLLDIGVAYCVTCGFIPMNTVTCRCGECWHYTDINACAGVVYEELDTIENLSPAQLLKDIKKYREEDTIPL